MLDVLVPDIVLDRKCILTAVAELVGVTVQFVLEPTISKLNEINELSLYNLILPLETDTGCIPKI